MTPDHVIARIDDPLIREAFLVVRSETFTITTLLRTDINKVTNDVAAHVSFCDHERNNDLQSQLSTRRIIDDLSKVVKTIQDTQRNQWSSAQRWVIGILVTTIGGSWALIVRLLFIIGQGHP